jgi:hypothetical protein
MGAFENLIQMMAGMDIFQLFFPWLFVLAVSFGLLEKNGVFSDDPSVNGVISLSFAFLTIGGLSMFVPAGMFTHFAAALGFGLFAIIGLLIMLAASGLDMDEALGKNNSAPTIGALIITIVALIAVVGYYLNIEQILGMATSAGGNAFDEVVMPILILIFLFLVVGATAGDTS